MSVVLIGYRGSGKSTVGRALAERLGMRFVDLDDEVCARFGGATVAEIWADPGEPAFRAAECDAVEALLTEPGVVIALGGGTPMQPVAADAIRRSSALKVYLQASAEELDSRTRADPASVDHRPALTAAGGGLDEVRAVLAEREPTYRALADREIDTSGQSVKALVDRIAAMAD
ncbi:MAG: shikimate kinase [Planctomycetota bacterium]